MTTPSMVNGSIRLADVGDGAVEEPRADEGDTEADDAAGGGEQHALDQELPHDAPAGRAEREAQRDLARPRGERDSSRLATLAQAMSSTKPTAPIASGTRRGSGRRRSGR